MGGGSSTPQTITTTQNKDPWVGAQQHLASVLNQASSLNANDVGYQPYSGDSFFNPYLENGYFPGAVNNYLAQAQGDVANLGSSPMEAGYQMAGSQIQNGGITPQLGQVASNLQGLSDRVNTANDALGYQYNYGLNNPENLYNTIASQAQGQENPYLQSIIAANDRRISDRVNSTMSGSGRYGSGAHTDVLARSLAEAANPLLAQDYEARQARLGQAAQGLAGITGQRAAMLGQQTQLAQSAGQLQGMQADIYGQGLNRAGQWAQLTPQLYQSRYAPAQSFLGANQLINDVGQQQRNADVEKWNLQQARPWEQIARYSAIANGAGGLGGSQTTTQPNLSAPAGGITGGLGGALAGGAAGSVFGPVGAGIGAIGGGLLGYLR